MDPYLWKRLWRRPWLSFCTVITTVIMCTLMGYLMNYHSTHVDKLEEAQQSLEIFCQVSNGQGTAIENLRAPQEILDYIYGEEAPLAPYIRDLRMTKNYEFWAPDSGIPEWNPAHYGVPLKSMNVPECWDWINPAVGGSAPKYFVEDFWNSDELICLVSDGIYRKLGSETFRVEIRNPAISFPSTSEYGRAQLIFTVAGTYQGAGETVLIPFAAAQKIAKLMFKQGSVDSVSFYVLDNRMLDEMIEIAAEQFVPVDPTSSDERFALLIRDDQYRATTAVLEQNVRRTVLLLPLLLSLSLCVGFLISFLATRNEQMTYSLMRTLGMTAGNLCFSVLREQLIPVGLGAAIGCCLPGNLLAVLAFVLCYVVGCVACIIKSIRVPTTVILREQE